MRFLHLADLHIGKMFNDVSMLEDQKSVLMDQIIETAKERDVEAVLIAGDVYQRSTPQAGAMELFSRFVSELVGMDKKVFIISGNHDSAQRISYNMAAPVYVSEAGKALSAGREDSYVSGCCKGCFKKYARRHQKAQYTYLPSVYHRQ